MGDNQQNGESNRLTAKFVEQVKTDGRYRDGAGLMLWVHGGSKRWVLRTVVQGKRCDLGLGSPAEDSMR